jgi:hypothetical protein
MRDISQKQKGQHTTMEEQQIRDFVHRVSSDETLRQELASNPQSIVERENFSPSVARVVLRLVPHLTLTSNSIVAGSWWY